MIKPAHVRPRALFCTDTYPPQVNGVSVVTALSVEGLRERGWDVEVVAPRYPGRLRDVFESGPLAPVTTVASVAMPGYRDIRLVVPDYFAVLRAARAFSPDVIHSETEFVLGRFGQMAARHLGRPVVSSYHTDFSRYTEAYGVPGLQEAVRRYLTRFHSRSDRVYTPSRPARDDLLALGVREVEVWGRGVDVRTFHPSRRSGPLRETYGSGNAFLLVHVGQLAAEKGVERILEAYDLARRQLPAGAVHLVIAGSGPRERALRSAAGDGVSFLGNLDRVRVLPRLYASCDAFLFSSLTETLGLVVLEAMACGLPVIATPAGGVADHLRDGVNGLAYPANDTGAMARSIVSLVYDRARARRLGEAARRTAEALSWDAELDRLDASYRDVCERAARRIIPQLATAS